MQEPADRLLTVAEVATYFRVDPESVRRWLREGKLLGIKLGRGPGWRIRVADLHTFVTKRRTHSGENPPSWVHSMTIESDKEHGFATSVSE
jgi:excisionase family DNA binding protein